MNLELDLNLDLGVEVRLSSEVRLSCEVMVRTIKSVSLGKICTHGRAMYVTVREKE